MTPSSCAWLWLALGALAALCFGELFEQIVFVPNWLVGDVAQNVAHFRAFKHTSDPGAFFFPAAVLSLIAHAVLWRRRAEFAEPARLGVRASFAMLLLTAALTAYVIPMLNLPLWEQTPVLGEAALHAMLWEWAVINVFRIALPAYGIWRLIKVQDLPNPESTA